MKIRELIKLLSEYGQDEDVDPDFLRSILPSVSGYKPAPPTHEDFDLMLADIRAFVKEHPGATVLPADDPAARYIGFTAFVGGGDEDEVASFFSIRLLRVRPALSRDPSLATPGGRRDLCRQLMSA